MISASTSLTGESLIVGFGHCGRLHRSALAELGAAPGSPARVLAVDPRRRPEVAGVELHRRLATAWAALEAPAEAVCHVTVPPGLHHEVVLELLTLGARRIVVEKPIAESAARAEELLAAAQRAGAAVVPVAIWPHSAVIAELVARLDGRSPQGLRFTQSKPRHRRTAWDRGHTSALQVEMPHQVLLALHLAGPVRAVRSAELWDLEAGARRYPRAGGARVVLEHEGGAVSELLSDLSAEQRVRRLALSAEGDELVAHLPTSAAVMGGELRTGDGRLLWSGADRPLTRFLRTVYERSAGESGPALTPGLHVAVVAILDAAAACAADDGVLPRAVGE